MEAMASGCTVVASNVGGNPELVKHGETGLLFEKADRAGLAECLRRLIEDDAQRQRLAGAASQLVRENFSLSRSVQRMEEIYDSFITERAPRTNQ